MHNSHLIWLDCEMTGLNPDTDHLIELAIVITDANLEPIAEGPNLVIHQSDDILAGMDEWNTRHHGRSGLTGAVRQSAMSVSEAEQCALAFVKQHVNAQQSPMCGNTIGQDRRFLRKYMPTFADYFHYRNLDVSSFKIATQLWSKDKLPTQAKTEAHRALADTYESIAEMRHYREHFFLKDSI